MVGFMVLHVVRVHLAWSCVAGHAWSPICILYGILVYNILVVNILVAKFYIYIYIICHNDMVS